MRAAATALALLLFVPAIARGQDEPTEGLRHVDIWLSAIRDHEPNRQDASAAAMLDMRTADFEAALPHMVSILRRAFALEQRRARFDDTFGLFARHRFVQAEIRAHTERARTIAPGLDMLLKRAAMLHADLGLLAPHAHLTTRRGETNMVADGRGLGEDGRPWHWMLGRAFLDLVVEPGQDAHVRLWYQTVGTHLLAIRDFTEANPHLERARELFPADAEIQFLTGFMHESQAAPDIQAALAERIAQLPPQRRGGARSTTVFGAGVEINAATDAYRKAVALDPAHLEAHVRLGRVLTLAGKAEEAARVLRPIATGIEPPALKYFAHLFLGRAEETLGNVDAARRAYLTAAQLYPDAQSPRMALSQMDLQAGDREAAGAIFSFLAASDRSDDPWWGYLRDRTPGRASWIARLVRVFSAEVR